MKDFIHIIRFFIDIFILQSNPSDSDGWQGEYKQLPPGATPDITYELRIRRGAEIKTRRMSIRRIGVPDENKSSCYMVTYDDFLVIKIPPAPITDFEEYLENIEVEKKISHQLNPSVTNLAPGLNPILCKIPEILKRLNHLSATSEEEYSRLLKKEPQYQRYLKICGQFVFFMELSQHAFFDQIINKIHSEKDRISNEIIKNSHVFDDLAAFESVYGSENEEIFLKINDLEQCFYLTLDDFLSRQGQVPHASVQDYEKQEWLFAALAEIDPEIERNTAVAALSDQIRQLLFKIFNENPETVEGFYDLVRSCVRRKIFDNHRTNIETLVIKMLALLFHLQDLGIAIRDLKPDNMIVAGKQGDYEPNLSAPDAYDLGLIDLETAVAFSGLGDPLTCQPMLAGTPLFMTPSHLFRNPVLSDVFDKKLSGIFSFQDWFAAIGIIFCIATGQRLFEKTAKLIPQIVRVKKQGVQKKNSETDILKNVSRIFWKSAAEEFSEKIKTNHQRLEAIQLSLPEEIMDLFFLEIRNGKFRVHDAIKQCAHSQKLFPRQAQRLVNASVDAIRAQQVKWAENGPQQKVAPAVRLQIIALFERLETFKSKLQDLDRNRQLIKTSVSCLELLTFMFNQVMFVMRCE